MESPLIAVGSFEELIALSWLQIAFPYSSDSSNKNWTMSNDCDEFPLKEKSDDFGLFATVRGSFISSLNPGADQAHFCSAGKCPLQRRNEVL
jgi:hypothetical protein